MKKMADQVRIFRSMTRLTIYFILKMIIKGTFRHAALGGYLFLASSNQSATRCIRRQFVSF